MFSTWSGCWQKEVKGQGMTDQPGPDWEAATWEGSRRAQLRRGLRLTPRQRLEAMVAIGDTARRLAGAPEAGESATTGGGGGAGPGNPGKR